MSRSFLGFGQLPYIGVPQSLPIKIGGISGQSITLLFQWISYGASTTTPNINVLVDLNGKACAPLDQIRSVYIDNLGSDTPVYVYFPDTQTTVVAQPNSEGWYPAYTNQRQIWVTGLGFITGDIPTTVVMLSNLKIEPSVNVELPISVAYWKASSLINRTPGVNNNYGTPALGDQTLQESGAFNEVGVLADNLWGTPLASGFIYLTNIEFTLQGVECAANAAVTIDLQATGTAGILYSYAFSLPVADSPFIPVQVMQRQGGKNIKLDATQKWQLFIPALTNQMNGNYSLITDYTVYPR